MELLIIEFGLSGQPLQEDYTKFSAWVTNSWIKLLWEKVSKFDISVTILTLNISPPAKTTSGS
jgi:hypothetical protein